MRTGNRSPRGTFDTSCRRRRLTQSSTCLPRKQHTPTGWLRPTSRSMCRACRPGRRKLTWPQPQTTTCPRCSSGTRIRRARDSTHRQGTRCTQTPTSALFSTHTFPWRKAWGSPCPRSDSSCRQDRLHTLRSRSRPQRRNTCPLDRGSGSSSWSSCSTCPRDTRLTPSSRRRRSSRLQGSACSRCCWRRR